MQLQMFVAAVEERSVRVAAERVFPTQLAVGIAVRKLEQAAGSSLHKVVKPTVYLKSMGDFITMNTV